MPTGVPTRALCIKRGPKTTIPGQPSWRAPHPLPSVRSDTFFSSSEKRQLDPSPARRPPYSPRLPRRFPSALLRRRTRWRWILRRLRLRATARKPRPLVHGARAPRSNPKTLRLQPSTHDSLCRPCSSPSCLADVLPSFIRDQMQLEADAREALPYVRLSLSPESVLLLPG